MLSLSIMLEAYFEKTSMTCLMHTFVEVFMTWFLFKFLQGNYRMDIYWHSENYWRGNRCRLWLKFIIMRGNLQKIVRLIIGNFACLRIDHAGNEVHNFLKYLFLCDFHKCFVPSCNSYEFSWFILTEFCCNIVLTMTLNFLDSLWFVLVNLSSCY